MPVNVDQLKIKNDENNGKQPKAKRPNPSPERHSEQLARVMASGETGIGNAFSSELHQIKQELLDAKTNSDRVVESAARALVTLKKELRPRIYQRAHELLEQEQAEEAQDKQFSLSDLASDVFDVDFSEVSDQRLFAVSIAGALPM